MILWGGPAKDPQLFKYCAKSYHVTGYICRTALKSLTKIRNVLKILLVAYATICSVTQSMAYSPTSGQDQKHPYRLIHDVYVLLDFGDRLVLDPFGLTTTQFRLLNLIDPDNGLRLTRLSWTAAALQEPDHADNRRAGKEGFSEAPGRQAGRKGPTGNPHHQGRPPARADELAAQPIFGRTLWRFEPGRKQTVSQPVGSSPTGYGEVS